MGSKIQGCISNATQLPIRYSLSLSQLQLDSYSFTTDVRLSLNALLSLSHSNSQLQSQGQASWDHKNHGTYNRIKSQSQLNVTPKSATRAGLTITPKQHEKYYLNLWVVGDKINQDCLLIRNLRVQDQRDIRWCIWIDNGVLKMTHLAKQPKSWRFQGGIERVNYPQGFSCEYCGEREKCKTGCPQKGQFGGN